MVRVQSKEDDHDGVACTLGRVIEWQPGMPSANHLIEAQVYGLWIQTGAIVISAIGAFFALYVTSRATKRRATIDLLIKADDDDRHKNLRQEFIRLRDEGDLVQWVKDPKSAECTVVREILNKYELIASGIREGILDEELYKRWVEDNLIKDFDQCLPFIHEVRRFMANNAYYREFEWLAKKWKAEAR